MWVSFSLINNFNYNEVKLNFVVKCVIFFSV